MEKIKVAHYRRNAMGEGKTMVQLKMEENAQLALLPEFPELEGLAERWEADGTHRTGKILSGDEALCDEIAKRVLLAESDRKIARELGVSRNSIKGVMRVLGRRGKLEPLKERLAKECGEVAGLSLSRFREALEDDLVSPQFLMVGAGIAIEKMELLTGGVTGRVEVKEAPVYDLEGLRLAAARLVGEARERAALEAGSSGLVRNRPEIIDIPGVATGLATALGVERGGQGAGIGVVVLEDGKGAGGGAAVSGGGPGVDGLAQGNLISKGGL